jgi:membrane fusion protein, multidrug efflux system
MIALGIVPKQIRNAGSCRRGEQNGRIVPMTASPASSGGSVAKRRRPLLRAAVAAAVVALGSVLGWQHFAHHPGAAAPAPPEPVPVIAATVRQSNFPIVLTGIGNVTALNTATVRSLITEPITKVDFKDGQYVSKGELLAQLDPGTLQAQLDQAEANLARDQAHLENGQINLGRYVPLAKQGFAPQQQVATQQAMIAQEGATIKADQAAIEYAKTELSYTRLVAPFDGVAGIRLLDVGNIIHASTSRSFPGEPNALVVVNQVQPISVIFTLAAADIPAVQDALARGAVKAIALGPDDELDSGTLAAINNQADPSSGTVTLKAIFPNPHRRLWPGMFVNVRVVTGVQANGLTVPIDAVQQGPQGQFVFVVGRDRKVSMQPVSVRETLNGVALIDKGLRAGETIVARGQYRLTPGAVVALANPDDPAAVPNPTTASAGLLPER